MKGGQLTYNIDCKETYVGEFLHIFGPRCAEHERLTVWANLTDNLADLRLESHV